ncbi:MAG: 4'-phosphopantetheinyl transferase superfamily protein [Pseudomonadota bacterium]|nr:4'-phosphopantetheinyl transferase superfamily protein [Pseudomonadota bacterium]
MKDLLPQPVITLFVTRCSRIDKAAITAYRTILSKSELDRNQRFRFAKDRHRDLISRALLRTELGKAVSLPPDAIELERGKHGKPQLAPSMQPMAEQVTFNVSHAGDWVILALSSEPVGIDIEYTPRNNDVMAVADRYFYGAELKELQAFSPSEQRERFFDYWTLKEAYIKARGEGISLGLANFGFSITSENTIRISMRPCLNDCPDDWQFWSLTPENDYRLALALKSSSRARLACYESVPLRYTEKLDWRLN